MVFIWTVLNQNGKLVRGFVRFMDQCREKLSCGKCHPKSLQIIEAFHSERPLALEVSDWLVFLYLHLTDSLFSAWRPRKAHDKVRLTSAMSGLAIIEKPLPHFDAHQISSRTWVRHDGSTKKESEEDRFRYVVIRSVSNDPERAPISKWVSRTNHVHFHFGIRPCHKTVVINLGCNVILWLPA